MALALGLALISLACGGGNTPADVIGPSTGTTYAFIADAPPLNSSILRFQITLSQAELCPTISQSGQCQGTAVTLLGSPVDIDLNQLQLKSAFLSMQEVNSGTYGGVRLTFANPDLKMLLADGSVRELSGPTGPNSLPLSPTTITMAFASPLSITANSNVSFLIDLNARDSIKTTAGAVTGISPVASVAQLPASGTQPIEDLQETTGLISSLSKSCPSGSITLTDSLTGLAITGIQFDGTTEFATGLNCNTLANNQLVETDVELLPSTGQSVKFFAKTIELASNVGGQVLEGTVFQVNNPTQANTSQFVLLVTDAVNLANAASGSFVTVTADLTEVTFDIESTGLTVDPTAFASGADLIAGQTVEVRVTSDVTVPTSVTCANVSDNCTASANTIRLKESTVTAQVTGTLPFTLGSLPSLFGGTALFRPLSADCQSCAVSSINVVTSDQTVFENPGGITGLQIANTVAVRGLLIKNGFAGPNPPGTGSPQLVAARVRVL